ncbi:MAG: TIGR03960 family B12-binding radical SAM protein [Gudongella sp.]|jgi:radical SAM family uncharacterized protein|nr:TIGR03960 family B12-binding radical SAM protein [Gudongella sp.]
MIDKYKLDKALMKVEKPARYIGMEQNSVNKDLSIMNVKFAFSFPDIYDVGMSHLGMHILYNLINSRDDMACERVFSPWTDMEEQMRNDGIPLYTLESKEEVKNFDFLGFTLQYEMSYTNILNILDLSRISLLSKDRTEDEPLVIAGGPCAYNPEPLWEFIDLFVIGEGEEVTLELLDLFKKHKELGFNRREFLIDAAINIKGIYVPSLYEELYNDDGTVFGRHALVDGIPMTIDKRMVRDVDGMFSPESMIVPYIETVHNRITMEIFRGCTHGCRFCQAGMIYRPIREKSIDRILELSDSLVESTGYETISLSSLSSCDYTQLQPLISQLMERHSEKKVGVSLPSLRVNSLSMEILQEIEKVRKTGLTFAPEAGSQRLRNVINKGVSEEELEETVSIAFREGWSRIKLYFMIGLPTETDEDVMGIKNIAYKVKDLFFNRPKEEKIGNFQVTASASCFVPKPFTPFQWMGQATREEFRSKINLLRDSIRDNKVKLNYHDPETSFLEAVISRGDRRISSCILRAWEKGCRFDGWSDQLNFDVWIETFDELGIDPSFYANRERSFEEIFPWDFINPGPTKKYLLKEYKKALVEDTTRDCRLGCTGCGISDCAMWGVFN